MEDAGKVLGNIIVDTVFRNVEVTVSTMEESKEIVHPCFVIDTRDMNRKEMIFHLIGITDKDLNPLRNELTVISDEGIILEKRIYEKDDFPESIYADFSSYMNT